MPILYCSLQLYLPYSHSLKEKRRVVKSVSDRLRSRFNMGISEIDHQDLWQRACIAAVTVGPDRQVLEKLSQKFLKECEKMLAGELVDYSVDIFDYD